jgi:CubicO group peptidase (beta-lactamase class C family)
VPPDSFEPARQLLRDGVAARAFPSAIVEVGRQHEVLWQEAFGRVTYDADAPVADTDTLFDLASLTKVIATATLTMRLIDRGALSLSDRVGRWLSGWRGDDRSDVTIRDLLAHASGLTAYLPFFRDYLGRAEFERAICTLPLEYPPRTQSIYSDLGFMLLGFIIEDAGRGALAAQFDPITKLLDPHPVRFTLPRTARARTAPTEVDSWRGRLLQGEVHDENAHALGGVAGHAGLFGSAGGVGRFAQLVLRTLAGAPILAQPQTMQAFVKRTDTPGSSRALAWDTMLPTSSCGKLMSPRAIGHTGFTGTSLWIDPGNDVYVVLLTNRVHPSRDNDAILRIRPAFHDAVMKGLGIGDWGSGIGEHLNHEPPPDP